MEKINAVSNDVGKMVTDLEKLMILKETEMTLMKMMMEWLNSKIKQTKIF